MRHLFAKATAFNQDLSKWSVGQVWNMSAMFLGAEHFNGSVSSWNVSQVRVMNRMFDKASSFNQVLERWEAVHVVMCRDMFRNSGYQQPRLAWEERLSQEQECESVGRCSDEDGPSSSTDEYADASDIDDYERGFN
jgi:hypothetical protein